MEKSKLKIGLIDSYGKKSKKLDEIIKQLSTPNGISFEKIRLEKIAKTADLKAKFDVLWWHYDENVDLPETGDDEEIKSSILSFVKSGGGLLLSLLAAQYIHNLGLEADLPEVIYKGVWDKVSWIEEFPDIRGFQGFRNHSIFENCYNGVYTWCPQKDEEYCEVYYAGRENKKARKPVAIGRGYISFDENLKLINEYNYGKGNILTIGSYLFFSPVSNRFKAELHLFTLNCLKYLSKKLKSDNNSYWPDNKFDLIKLNDEKTKFKIRKKNLILSENELDMPGKGGDNHFDLTGRRTLIMGKEQGGISEIWFHPFRAVKDFHFHVVNPNGRNVKDSDVLTECNIQPGSIKRKFEVKQNRINEIIFASLEKPGTMIFYQVNAKDDLELVIKFSVDFRYMWPYSANLMNPIKYYLDKGLNCLVISCLEGELSLAIGASTAPKSIDTEIISNDHEKIVSGEKEQNLVRFTLKYSLNKKGANYLPFVITGSNVSIKESIETYKSIIGNPQYYYDQQQNYYKKLLKHCTQIETPDIEFNRGYELALIGTDKFFGETKPLGKSFFAGFSVSKRGWGDGRPGYAWYFCRDSIWTAFAVLKYGDFEKVKDVISFLGKYQNVDGKIFHEFTTSGCLHYDAADSTPLFIALCGNYLKSTGDIDFIKKEWGHIQKAIDFCYSTDTDKDRLIENTNVGHGWIEGGYLWPQHSEAYLTACWAEALKEAAYISEKLKLKNESSEYGKESEKVINIFNKKFWNTLSEFYNVGKQKDNIYTDSKTSLIAVPLLFNHGEFQKAMKVLKEYAGSNFSTDWGTRIIREDSKEFKPAGYHYGAVWPLFTGWVSLAEYRYSRGLQGFTHLMSNLSLHKFWSKGNIQEVLNGEEFLPSGVCFHQAWSESMVIQPALEGMLGLRTDAMKNELTLSPDFPAHWDKVSVKNIRMGKEVIDFQFFKTKDKYCYKISKKPGSNLKIVFMPHLMKYLDINKIKINGKPVNFDIEILEGNLKCILNLNLKTKAEIEIDYFGGINILPIIPKLHIGSKSKGLRIIKDVFIKNNYKIILEGKREHSYIFRVFSNGIKINDIDGGKIISRTGNIYEIEVLFEDSKNKYYEKEVVLKF